MARHLGKGIVQSLIQFDDEMEAFPNINRNQDNIVSYGSITPNVIKSALTDAKNGDLAKLWNIYEDMFAADARYAGLVRSVSSTIQSMDLKVAPKTSSIPGEQAIANAYQELVQRQLELLPNPDDLVEQFFHVYMYGARLYEMKWFMHDIGRNRKAAFVSEIRKVPNNMIGWNTDRDQFGEMYLRTNFGKVALSEFHPRSFLWVPETNVHTNYWRMGVARTCLFWYAVKGLNAWWWNQYTEKYGEPIRIAKTPTLTQPGAMENVIRFLKTIGKSGYGIFPEGVEVQLIEANRQGTITTYQDIIAYADKAFEVAMVGQVGTVGDQRQGSYAKAEVQNGVRLEILKAIAKTIKRGFDELSRHVIIANYGAENVQHHLLPEVKPLVVNIGDRGALAQVVSTLQDNGVPIPIEFIYEHMGIPLPSNGDFVLHNKHVEVFGDFSEEHWGYNGSGPEIVSESGMDRTETESGSENESEDS